MAPSSPILNSNVFTFRRASRVVVMSGLTTWFDFTFGLSNLTNARSVTQTMRFIEQGVRGSEKSVKF